jgi:predicted amidophosphoribosyltransferase
MWREALSLLVPPACCSCGAPGADDVLCASCRRALPWLTGPRCERCGLPGRCGRRCPAARAAFDAAWAPLAHAGPARELVAALKFRGALRVADTMAAQIVAGAPPGLLDDGRALVPVPSTAARRLLRGFDHADCLARALQHRTGLPLRRCVRRAGVLPAGARQLGAGRAQRLEAGRIAMRATGAVPARAALVDDVHTTGATLNACAIALRKAGCCDVVALTYSRALR